MPSEQLDRLTERLERAAAELRAGSLDPDRAAAVVDECARLAGEASVELDRQVRAGDADPGRVRAAGARLTEGYPEHLREEVEAYLAGLRFADEPAAAGLEEAMRYSLLAGGKRIRPVLALATARALGREPREVLPLGRRARAHPHLLADPRRPARDGRRRPAPRAADVPRRATARTSRSWPATGSTRRRSGTCSPSRPAEPAHLLAAVCELAAATGVNGMVGGQYIDVRGLVDGGAASLRRLHELKTGRLIGASVECVLLLVRRGAAATTLTHFRSFAAELGLLFQIVDDILDVTGTEVTLGKPQGSDERHGKLTYVSSYGLEGAREMARESHRNARDALAKAARTGTGELEQITDFIYTRTT